MTTSPSDDSPLTPDRTQCQPSTWVDLYGDTLFRYALMRTGETSVAEDIVQETFIAALKACREDRFRGSSSEKTWLTGILKHKVMDYFRRKYRESPLPFNEELASQTHSDSFDHNGKWATPPSRWKTGPLDQLEQQEVASTLLSCIDDLPPKQADAIRMREFEEHESEDICKVLSITPTNYWVLLHRARLLLRQCMDHYWNTEHVGDRI